MSTESDVLLWAQYRLDNVRPISNLAFSFRQPSLFGQFGWNKLRSGELFVTRWKSLVSYSPNSIEIHGKSQPFIAFLNRLSASEPDLKLFFSQTCYLALYSCDIKWAELVTIMLFSPGLSIMELIDCPEFLFSELRLQLRFLRLSGTDAMKLSTFKELRVVMNCVELLALQELDCDLGSVDADFLDSLGRYFPNMKYFFLDWNIVSPAFMYDESTVDILEAVAALFRKLKLTFFGLLIYCPDEEIRQDVEKLRKYLESVNVKVKLEAFSCTLELNAPDNFMLAVIGERANSYVKRLFETVVCGKVSRPDLRHFAYIIDREPLLMHDSVVQFGGFDESQVREEFSRRTEAVWLPSELQNGLKSLNN
ncbi:hypothetical protein TTRE_0000185501 [Trichuris trichiura]|uniref:Uncharacterized protein n=1 Tax=Trichuris trichiura TaxID=36087 RepID=A0A077Z4E7_TRITR|nr:hypothetical protein TTRE_0000185501 [Trichuris trichiura]